MKGLASSAPLLIVALSLFGCDGQQYVSPSTALLTVTSDKTGSKLVSRCNYVPVLWGAQVDGHYSVDGALDVFITLTRDEITVVFQRDGDDFEPFRIAAKELETGAVTDPSPPTGYTMELSSGCTPDEP
jgi:hypothetical protein